MTFMDVKCFTMVLFKQLHETFFGEPPSRKINRNDYDDEDMALLIERTLEKITDAHMKPQYKLAGPLPHRILVIDEVDAFQHNEKAFTYLISHILKGSQQGKGKVKTSTTIIGIANSVDLPFRKKHTAIAMRDCQLLFQPYDEEDIQSIIEQKVSTLFYSNLKPDPRDERFAKMWVYVKRILHDLMDEPAMRYLCKNIAKSSGDIRIVFDIMKSATMQLLKKVQESPEQNFVMKTGSQHLPVKFSITLEMIVAIIDAKRGPRVK